MSAEVERIEWNKHWTDSLGVYLENKDLARLRPVLKPYLHGKVADIGCGVNTMYGPEDVVTGVDISPECVRIMTERCPLGTWVVGDVRNTGLPEATYDTVVCCHVLEHFYDQTPILEEMKRICKPDGDIVIVVPRSSKGPDHVHPRWYPAKIEDRIACHLKDPEYAHRARAHWIITGKRTATASIVTIAWSPKTRRLQTMQESVQSFRTETKYPHTWVVVDNGPEKQTEFVSALAPDIHIVNKKLHNPSQSRNMGALATSSDYLAFVDNDVVFYEGWLEESIAILEKYPDRKFIVSLTRCPVMRRKQHQAGYIDEYKLSKFSGSLCWVMKRRSFLEVGRWNETDAAEDVDYSHRASEAGYLFLYRDKPPYVRHIGHRRTREAGDRFVDGVWQKATVKGYGRQVSKCAMIVDHALEFELRVFVETGTHKGDTVKAMLLSNLFTTIYSVDNNAARAHKAKHRFRSFPHIHCAHSDNSVWIPEVLKQIDEPALFWLNAHAAHEQVQKSGTKTLLLDEIRAIAAHRTDHVIIVDGARYYDGSLEDYPGIKQIQELLPSNWNCEVDNDIIRIHRHAHDANAG